MPHTAHPPLPPEIASALRHALPKCGTAHALPDEVKGTIASLCRMAKDEMWTPEQVVVAVKDVCYSSNELQRTHSSSERDNIVARIVTASIREYYRAATTE